MILLSVGKKLIVQFSVKHAQNIDCGGGYIKLLPSGLDQKKVQKIFFFLNLSSIVDIVQHVSLTYLLTYFPVLKRS